MTPAQTLQRMGFLESLRVRGVTLSFRLEELPALLERIDSSDPEKRVGKDESALVRVVVLREHLEGPRPVIGDEFVGPSEEKYRITTVEDNPASIKVAYHCKPS